MEIGALNSHYRPIANYRKDHLRQLGQRLEDGEVAKLNGKLGNFITVGQAGWGTCLEHHFLPLWDAGEFPDFGVQLAIHEVEINTSKSRGKNLFSPRAEHLSPTFSTC